MGVNFMRHSELFERAINAYKHKDYITASAIFKEIINHGSKTSSFGDYLDSNLYYGKMILRDSMSTIDDVKDYFAPVLKYGTTVQKEQAFFELANKSRLSGDIMKAFIFYDTCLLLMPFDTYALTDVANLCLCQNILDASAWYFQNLIEIAPFIENYRKKQIALNSAYIGLAKIAVKKDNPKEARFHLSHVRPFTKIDNEQLEMVNTSIYFAEERLDEALSSLDVNINSRLSFIQRRSFSKLGVIHALKGDGALSFEYLKNSFNPYDNITLGALYFEAKEYKKACESYLIATRIDEAYFVNALECAMYFDEVLAIKIVNNLLTKRVPQDQYSSILLYLSKKYNIFFNGVDYDDLNPYDEAILYPSLNKSVEVLKDSNKLGFSFCYASTYLADTINYYLENQDPRKSKINGPITDKYVINIPFIGWNREDYLIIETLKNTKEVVQVYLSQGEELKKDTTRMILKRDKNISKIFK